MELFLARIFLSSAFGHFSRRKRLNKMHLWQIFLKKKRTFILPWIFNSKKLQTFRLSFILGHLSIIGIFKNITFYTTFSYSDLCKILVIQIVSLTTFNLATNGWILKCVRLKKWYQFYISPSSQVSWASSK